MREFTAPKHFDVNNMNKRNYRNNRYKLPHKGEMNEDNHKALMAKTSKTGPHKISIDCGASSHMMRDPLVLVSLKSYTLKSVTLDDGNGGISRNQDPVFIPTKCHGQNGQSLELKNSFLVSSLKK